MSGSETLTLAHTRIGDAGPAIVLVHGFAGNQSTWRFWTEDLAQDHLVYTVDLKGFGASPKPRDRRYAPEDQARLLHHWLEQQDLRGVTLVGHSLGGGVALLTALADRERADPRLSRLCIVAGPAFPQVLPRFITMARIPLLGPTALRLLSPERIIRMALSSIVFDPGAITEEQIENYATPLGSPGGRYGLLTSARQIVPPDLTDVVTLYPSLALPTLLLWGRHDIVVPLAIGERLARTLPNAELVVLERCGHVVPEEKPDAALGALRSFLRRHPL